MNKTIMALFLAAVSAAATPALARPHHAAHDHKPVYSTPAGNIDSGYYPPRTWNEIEISGPNSY
jgi:hypothetical protein